MDPEQNQPVGEGTGIPQGQNVPAVSPSQPTQNLGERNVPQGGQGNGGVPPPSKIPESKAVVTTVRPDVNKKRILILVTIGVILLALAGGGGYYFYSQNISSGESDSQSLTNLPSPATGPTGAIAPTINPLPTTTQEGGFTGEYCSALDLTASPSAFLQSYCQGDLCSSETNMSDCENVDVVSTGSGRLSRERVQDNVGDCLWDETSGFNKCKPKY